MMRKLAIAFFLALRIVVSSAGANASGELVYSIKPVEEQGYLERIEFHISFVAMEETSTLVLPNRFGNVDGLWRSIEALRVDNGTLVETDDASVKRLEHAPNSKIDIYYEVHKGGNLAGDRGGIPVFPLIQDDWFHVLGAAVFVIPDVPETTQVKVKFETPRPSFEIASDLEKGSLRISDLRRSVLVGGHYQVLKPGGGQLTIALDLNWQSDADILIESLRGAYQSQLGYWKTNPTRFWMVLTEMVHDDSGANFMGGVGLEDSFTFFATPEAPVDIVLHRVTHEVVHNWLPGPAGSLGRKGGSLAERWLSEGFTDYLTAATLVEAGIWSVDDFVSEVNRLLKDYTTSVYRSTSYEALEPLFWRDDGARKAVYDRGRMLAYYWQGVLYKDHGIRLFDLLQELAGPHYKYEETTFDRLVSAAKMHNFDAEADIIRFIYEGQQIKLPSSSFSQCGYVDELSVPVFDLGFDLEATFKGGGTVQGLLKDSNAYAAGLRDGTHILSREQGELGNTEAEMVFRVRTEDGVEREISYLPRSREMVVVQQIRTADLGEALCLEQITY